MYEVGEMGREGGRSKMVEGVEGRQVKRWRKE